eukprot:CAMPEP_0175770674 /NCGR_PEP_ID=MMETSP0097-20121207/71627_1 /TAXON_ID=311494 /ORGANISM="Alexandrium monilatum, Strain CCMP3105" /LENGTH=195 /DNA_ID=CAMNT_0017080947 /DNA_START=30 /DNA_END=613 /DNA_ORIENTATION=+
MRARASAISPRTRSASHSHSSSPFSELVSSKSTSPPALSAMLLAGLRSLSATLRAEPLAAMLLGGLGGLSATLLGGLAGLSLRLLAVLGLRSDGVESSSTASTGSSSFTQGAFIPQLLHCVLVGLFISPHCLHSHRAGAASGLALDEVAVPVVISGTAASFDAPATPASSPGLSSAAPAPSDGCAAWLASRLGRA